MTEGGIWTGHKMKSAGLRKTAVCPICKNHADEDEEHVIWGYQDKKIKEIRETVINKWGKDK